MSHCTIANANNVGVFVDDHAQVKYSFVVMSLEAGSNLTTSLLEVGSICRGGREGRREKKGGRKETRGGGGGGRRRDGKGRERRGGEKEREGGKKTFCSKLLTTSAAYFILPPIGSV